MFDSITPNRSLKILGVYAHPDDESFCVGGTLAKCAAAGAETMVISFTQGEAGQIHDSTAATRRTLGQTRARELEQACQRLGVQHVRCLNYGDGKLSEVNHRTLVSEVTRVIREFRPDVVLTFGADGAYGHPDHIAIGAATDEAVRLASNPTHCPHQIEAGLLPHAPAQLYHSYFPRQNRLLLDYLATWLQSMEQRFHGCPEYVRGLTVFANSLTMLGYANDHVDVEWFAPGFYIVEQGEPASSLYLILSGCADMMREHEDGHLEKIGELCSGQFFGETGLATDQPRNVHVIARDSLSCLVLSPHKPADFAGRGAQARFTSGIAEEEKTIKPHSICIDISDFVMSKVAAIAAHRTQCPISLDMFPKQIWHTLLGHEYFVCADPNSYQLASG